MECRIHPVLSSRRSPVPCRDNEDDDDSCPLLRSHKLCKKYNDVNIGLTSDGQFAVCSRKMSGWIVLWVVLQPELSSGGHCGQFDAFMSRQSWPDSGKNFPVQRAKPTTAAQYDQLVHGRLSGPFLKEYFVFKTFDPGDIFRRKSV